MRRSSSEVQQVNSSEQNSADPERAYLKVVERLIRAESITPELAQEVAAAYQAQLNARMEKQLRSGKVRPEITKGIFNQYDIASILSRNSTLGKTDQRHRIEVAVNQIGRQIGAALVAHRVGEQMPKKAEDIKSQLREQLLETLDLSYPQD